ncbi:hypothetical protein J1N35_038374 [Gossypium stocksii]|uniref:Uncharacterized protein n=1 Tax=Gossypium stocksii TaxID=47602 RepID=A0A9D3ULR3_9ROSI|nr:hypothetical protein J1N35_038374 [Gossypium stocksii]
MQGDNHDVAEKYGPWMLVDQCPRKSDRKTMNGGGEDSNVKCELLHVNGLDQLGQTNEPKGSFKRVKKPSNILRGKGEVMNKIAERLGVDESFSTSDIVKGVSSGTVQVDTTISV